MKRLKHSLLLFGLFIAGLATTAQAETFSGVFLTGNGEGVVGGNIHLTLNGNEVRFQSTWLDYWTAGTTLEPVWQLPGMQVSFDLGDGTPGQWELGKFLGPIPGVSPVPPGEDPIDPGFNVPLRSDGMRFSGSFIAPAGFEDALLTSAGMVQMQIHGTVNIGGSPVHDPVLSAVLVPVPEPSVAALLGLAGAALWIFRRNE